MLSLRIGIVVWLLCFFVAGCTREQVYENVYEGLQKREQLVHPSDGPIQREHQSFYAYQRERQESLKKDREGPR